MVRRIILIYSLLLTLAASASDSMPSPFARPMQWRVGVEVSPAWVPGTNSFLDGFNSEDRRISRNLSGAIRADFSFNPASRWGRLYRGLYQGIGVSVNSYFAPGLLGTPVSVYVYQGAPIAHFGRRLWLGYEWQFGAAFGWKHYDAEADTYNAAVSTPVTAHMALGVKLHYALSERLSMSVGIGGNHYSNGNTSWPNGGVNTLGASVGIAYVINPTDLAGKTDPTVEAEADRHRWFYDITAFCTWRKRVGFVGDPPDMPVLFPGRFGILGLQFSPMYCLNRWVAIGPGVDVQWDEGAALSDYWVDGFTSETLKFVRPPVGEQISVGISAHAELTTPIFTVNAGIGCEILNPKGEPRFYQSLTLKTFVTKHIYLNTGYRLGDFKDPQNLMIGLGVRL